jgi:hypothetical protein
MLSQHETPVIHYLTLSSKLVNGLIWVRRFFYVFVKTAVFKQRLILGVVVSFRVRLRLIWLVVVHCAVLWARCSSVGGLHGKSVGGMRGSSVGGLRSSVGGSRGSSVGGSRGSSGPISL